MSRRHSLVTFERATTTTDDYGEETPAWATFCQEYAQVFYGPGDERRQAAMEQGGQPATFQVPSNANTRAVTLKDRIVFDGRIWDIESRAPDRPNRRLMEFTAVSSDEEVEIGEPAAFDFTDPVNSGLLTLILEDA